MKFFLEDRFIDELGLVFGSFTKRQLFPTFHYFPSPKIPRSLLVKIVI